MELAALVGLILTIAILGALLGGFLSRRLDLLSFQTAFLMGVVFFFTLPMALMWTFELRGVVYTPQGWGWGTLAAAVVVFMLFYVLGSRLGTKTGWFGQLIPKMDLAVNQPAILCTIAVSAVLVAGMFFLRAESLVQVFILSLRGNVLAFMLGLSLVLLIRQPFNPMYWALALVLLMGGTVVTVMGDNGRRYLLSFLLVVPWVAYWGWLRYRKPGLTLAFATAAGIAVTIVVAGWTAIRHSVDPRVSSVQQRGAELGTAIRGEALNVGTLQRVFLQDATVMSVYVIENYPHPYPLYPFHGIYFFAVNPVPRIIWEDKPLALGIQMQKQLQVEANLGPGIIGHGWYEGMWLGVIGYALFFGVLMSACDRLVRDRFDNPYFVCAAGANLSNILALPRGETFQFLTAYVYGFAAMLAVAYFVKFALDPMFRSAGQFSFGPPPGYWDQDAGGEASDGEGAENASPTTDGPEHARGSALPSTS